MLPSFLLLFSFCSVWRRVDASCVMCARLLQKLRH
jgi:hypothetical protein